MVSTLFRDPQARSSALAALGTLQPRAFGSLNRVETLDSVSNYYVNVDVYVYVYIFHDKCNFCSNCLTVCSSHDCCWTLLICSS